MAGSKLVLMKTKKPPTWKEWNEMKSQEKQSIKERITMTQADARATLDGVIGAETQEQACLILKSFAPTRQHLTFWLGQIGRRKDAGLGKNLDLKRYLNSVVENLRSREQQVVIVSRDRDGNSKKRIVKPVSVMDRDGQGPGSDNTAKKQEEIMDSMGEQTTVGTENDNQLEPEVVSAIATAGADRGEDSTPVPSTPQISRLQDYAIKNLLVFADCAVQTDWWGVFDVLARNFDNSGFLSYWLNKVGYGHLTPYSKGKDLVDYIRKVAHEIHRDIKASIGKPIARW